MKNFTSAVLMLIASSTAVATEQNATGNAPLVLAYNQSTAQDIVPTGGDNSQARAERVLATTLDVVSASLSVELDSFNAPQLPTRNKQ